MKRIISYMIIFALCFTMLPTSALALETDQRYTETQIETIVQKYEYNEDMLNALFCSDTAIGYWGMINRIKQNGTLTWALDMSSKLIGEYPEKQDYAEMLANLIAMQSGELAEQIATQSRFDDLKDTDDYAWDVVEIAAAFVGASGALETISAAIDTGVNGVSDVIIQNNDQAKYYEATLQDFLQSYAFLSAITKYAESEELRNVASSLLNANDTLLIRRLEYLADAGENIAKYEAQFFIKNMSMELLKEADLYATDETVKFFVDEGINLKNAILSAWDAASFTFKILILAGDIGFGTSDVYNRYQEMKVVADIAGALAKANDAILMPTGADQAKLEIIQEKCNLYKALIVTHARGEYLLYQLLMNDAGALSDIRWIIEYFKNPEDTTDAWYQGQIDVLTKYCDTLNKMFVVPSNVNIDNLVSDAYTDSIIEGNQTYCYHIPQVNLKGNRSDAFNAKIYDKFYSLLTNDVYQSMEEYDYPNLSEVVYAWGQKDNLVSIVVQTDATMYAWTDFYVYTISTETGEEVASSDLYEIYGLTENGFYDLVKTTMQTYWDGRRDDLAPNIGENFFQSLVDRTLTDDNVKASIPYINANGELCVVANIYSPAGADSYLHLLNTSGEADEGWIECTVDHFAEETESDISLISITNLIGTWYSPEAELAYIFKSTGNDLYPTKSGLSLVDGTYTVINLSKETIDYGGFNLTELGDLVLYADLMTLPYRVTLNNNVLLLDNIYYSRVSTDLHNQLIGSWKNNTGSIDFDGEIYTKYTDSIKDYTCAYYVLSDNTIAVNHDGNYHTIEYGVDGTELAFNGDIYLKDGTDNSANVLAGVRESIIGSWYNKTFYQEYVFYHDGTYVWNQTIIINGNVVSRVLLESGSYEIVNATKINLYQPGDLSYTVLCYHAQDCTLSDAYNDSFLFEKIE